MELKEKLEKMEKELAACCRAIQRWRYCPTPCQEWSPESGCWLPCAFPQAGQGKMEEKLEKKEKELAEMMEKFAEKMEKMEKELKEKTEKMEKQLEEKMEKKFADKTQMLEKHLEEKMQKEFERWGAKLLEKEKKFQKELRSVLRQRSGAEQAGSDQGVPS